MKKKLLAIMVAIMLVATLIPTLGFAEELAGNETPTPAVQLQYCDVFVGDEEVSKNSDEVLLPTHGKGWSYADGVLTLENYQGNGILLFGSPDASVKTSLTIRLVGENKISMSPDRDGLCFFNSDLVFVGEGSLDIIGTSYKNPISVREGTLTFALDKGGVVRIDANQYHPMGPLASEFHGAAAVMVYSIEESTRGSETWGASERSIILAEGNKVLRPEDYVITTISRDRAIELSPAPSPSPDTEPVPTPVPEPNPTPGHVPGPMPNPTPGDVPGPMPNPTPGDVPGPMPNPTPGDVPGPMPNPTPGDVPGPMPNPTPGDVPPAFPNSEASTEIVAGTRAAGLPDIYGSFATVAAANVPSLTLTVMGTGADPGTTPNPGTTPDPGTAPNPGTTPVPTVPNPGPTITPTIPPTLTATNPPVANVPTKKVTPSPITGDNGLFGLGLVLLIIAGPVAGISIGGRKFKKFN